jgi:hypothetical protein
VVQDHVGKGFGDESRISDVTLAVADLAIWGEGLVYGVRGTASDGDRSKDA